MIREGKSALMAQQIEQPTGEGRVVWMQRRVAPPALADTVTQTVIFASKFSVSSGSVLAAGRRPERPGG